jgi:hypothetical protein
MTFVIRNIAYKFKSFNFEISYGTYRKLPEIIQKSEVARIKLLSYKIYHFAKLHKVTFKNTLGEWS